MCSKHIGIVLFVIHQNKENFILKIKSNPYLLSVLQLHLHEGLVGLHGEDQVVLVVEEALRLAVDGRRLGNALDQTLLNLFLFMDSAYP